jgi:ADP-ribose pyrophosphatase
MSNRKNSTPEVSEASSLKDWEVISHQEVYSDPPWVKVSKQEIRVSDGSLVTDYHHIDMPDHVIIFAQSADGRVVVERQYKHGVGQITLTLPAGGIEQGETALAAAKRELLEETGYKTEDWQELGSFTAHGNYGCGTAHLFLAQNAQCVIKPKLY